MLQLRSNKSVVYEILRSLVDFYFHEVPTMMDRFVANLDYDDGKFSMRAGDILVCEQKHDGWCGGTNLRTQQRGWYPLSYVRPELSPPPTFPAPAVATVIPVPTPPVVPQAPSMGPNVHQQQNTYPQAQVLHTQSEHYTSKGSSRTPPAWATSQQPVQNPSSASGAVRNSISSVGQWFQQGLGSSSIGNATPTQRVTNSSTITSRSTGSFFSPGTSATHRTSVVQEVPSQTGAGRLAKRVGDGAVLSAVWGATTMHPRQALRAAAVATTAYAVEGNERNRAQQQQAEFVRRQEEEHRRVQEERRKNSWIKW